MAFIRFLINFYKLSDQKLLEQSNLIVQKMTGNTYFPTPTPALTVITAKIAEFTTAVTDAASGDRYMSAAKNRVKEELAVLLQTLSYYVQLTTNDRLAAQSSGIPMAKSPIPKPEMPQPVGVVVSYTDQSGIMQISCKKVKAAIAYIHQYTPDPLMGENSWTSMTCSSIKCMLDGLTPGTMYYFRVAAVGSREQIKYSEIVSKIAA